MPEPYNYAINAPNPLDEAVKGYALGGQINAQRQAQERAASLQKALGNLVSIKNPTASDYAAVMVPFPEMGENLKRAWDVQDAGQKQAKLSQGTQVFAAINAGRPDIAKDRQPRLDAMVQKQPEQGQQRHGQRRLLGSYREQKGELIHQAIRQTE